MNVPINTNLNIAIIGLGYVGLPLAVEFGKKYPVIGFDVNASRIASLKKRGRRNLAI
jgi:UDP-N-acetyl-D-galactosamine dehydrogenase